MALEAWKSLVKKVHGEDFLTAGESVKDPRECREYVVREDPIRDKGKPCKHGNLVPIPSTT